MKVLFIGGTGLISSASTALALERGIDLVLLNRGKSSIEVPNGATVITGDISKPGEVAKLIEGQTFDAVVNWVNFTPDQIARDVELFSGRCGQYIFISSASAYQKPVSHYLITESTPLANPYWQYSRNKIACEEKLTEAYRENGFPGVVVRPSHTYGETRVPYVVGSSKCPWTTVGRMLAGKKIVVPGDGTSLWSMTHNTDFAKGLVGLLGNPQTIGNAFHITTDEVNTWDQITRMVARAAGVEANIVHIPSDLLVAYNADLEGTLIGDKSASVVFDNSKIKRFVPGFAATTSLAEGVRKSVAWFQADPARQRIDDQANEWLDMVIAKYESVFPMV
ncbi:MAG TPA: SDR family oxidoreductase [Phycisphaerae bacterium]|nr:SDR family oxidoreductase [Phycisphaerae bacterium]